VSVKTRSGVLIAKSYLLPGAKSPTVEGNGRRALALCVRPYLVPYHVGWRAPISLYAASGGLITRCHREDFGRDITVPVSAPAQVQCWTTQNPVSSRLADI